MKKEIEEMIVELESGQYDQEDVHYRYDELLERFIIEHNFSDPELLNLMEKLISTPANFWYA